MNLTKTPNNSDVESLRQEFPQLEIQSSKPAGQSKAATSKSKELASALKKSNDGSRKAEKEKSVSLTLPDPTISTPPAPKPAAAAAPSSSSSSKRRNRSPELESEEESDDDDGGLTIEYPGGEPPSVYRPQTNFSPAFPTQMGRRFSDFVRDAGDDEDDDDADAEFEAPKHHHNGYGQYEEEEDDDDDDDHRGSAIENFKLPSPVNNHRQMQQYGDSGSYGGGAPAFGSDADGDADLDLEADLEAELEREFQKASGELDMDSESSVSEED
jgi:hypothetical protein